MPSCGSTRAGFVAQGCYLAVFLNGTISTWCVCVMEDIDMVFFSIIFFEHGCGEDCEVQDLSLLPTSCVHVKTECCSCC